MPDGSYLSGKFARQTKDVARQALSRGLLKWKEITPTSKPVPTNSLAIYGGDPFQKGGMKLQVAYRDLPRGKVQRPGDARFPNPYNLGWYDLTPADARSFLTTSPERVALPDQVFQKLALTQLKDAVRGQVSDWKKGAIQKGQLFTQLSSIQDSKITYQLSGKAELSADGRTFSPSFHGSATFDTFTGEFTSFRLIAAGQRSGKAGANGRATDLGPAPMGIALTLYKP